MGGVFAFSLSEGKLAKDVQKRYNCGFGDFFEYHLFLTQKYLRNYIRTS